MTRRVIHAGLDARGRCRRPDAGMIIGGDTGDDRFIEKEVRARAENRLSLLEEGVSGRAMPVFVAPVGDAEAGVDKSFG